MSPSSQPSKLFEPLQLGRVKLSNRIVLAPLTRLRASDSHVPLTDLVPAHYEQRAKAFPGTLLISEATLISPAAGGHRNAPEIYSEEQIAAWKEVTARVHQAGSHIFLQLWALGRVADSTLLQEEGSGDLISASAVPAGDGEPVPRPLTEAEIQQFIRDYARAATNAIAAGFDGVEIHGANGYLVDQFIQDVSNQRTDRWGGSVENRSRFALEVIKAVVAAVGADRTAIRLSPWSEFQGMRMADPLPQFTHLIAALKPLGLAYLHLVESRVSGSSDLGERDSVEPLVRLWDGASPLLLAGGFTPALARKTVDETFPADQVAVVFGRHFISNPDLVYRVQKGIALTPYDRSVFYTAKSPTGYADYEFSEEWKAEHPN